MSRKNAMGNVLHFDFGSRKKGPKTRSKVSSRKKPKNHWSKQLDIRTPWVLRLMAVAAILILSMLIL